MNFLPQLQEYADRYDLKAMDTLVESLSPVQREENRQPIIDAYYSVYSNGMYDLNCSQVDDPQNLVFYLLGILNCIQRFFPDQEYDEDRACCYEYLADYAPVYEDKLRYKQQAIDIYNTMPQTTEMKMTMVRVLIDKMELTQQFTTAAFTELLSFFRPALTNASLVNGLIHQCFRVRFLPFAENLYWFQRLLAGFEGAMHEHAEHNLLVYLKWAETYHYLLHHDTPEIDVEYKATMVAQTALLLKPLEDYYSDDEDLLNRLGKAFADTAERSTDNDLRLNYYQTAVGFFTKATELAPASWTFPVYATNALLNMARLYHEQGAYEKLINAFEQGLQVFSQVYKHEEDLMLNLYWGDFLIAYTGMAYDYKSPSLNRRAEEKLQLAIQLGDNYYTRPYFSLARLAIKSGDKEKCIRLLLECKAVIRTSVIDSFDQGKILADEDFRDIWDQLRSA